MFRLMDEMEMASGCPKLKGRASAMEQHLHLFVLKFWRRQAAALAGLADGRSSGSSVVYVSSPDQINHGDKLEVELHLPALNSLLLLLLLLTVETDSTWNKFECFKISGVETNQPPRVDRSLQ